MLGFDLALTSKYKQHFQEDFEDLGKIGSGGFATVHRVRSKLDQRYYALKVLDLKPSQCKQDVVETIHKFLQEVKVLSYLNHRNVVQYHGCWVECQSFSPEQIQEPNEQEAQDNSQIYMVVQEDFSSGGIQFACSSQDSAPQFKHSAIEFSEKEKENAVSTKDTNQASGQIRAKYKFLRVYILSQLCDGNVQTYLYQRNIRKKKERAIQRNQETSDQLMENYKMILQIVEGLEYLHSKKIIHRDIKLHNIVFDKQKKCKIIDYGLAKKARMLHSISEYPKEISLDSDFDEVFSSSVGTKIYSSPEQISSEKYDHRTDIYSLAIVILMFFCDFTTTHQELRIIERIRKVEISFINADERLKSMMAKCLGQEKNRPRLSQIKELVKKLLRERYQRQSKKLPENSLSNNQKAMEKEQSIYIIENAKLKKKISKDEYMQENEKEQESLREKQNLGVKQKQTEKFCQKDCFQSKGINIRA